MNAQALLVLVWWSSGLGAVGGSILGGEVRLASHGAAIGFLIPAPIAATDLHTRVTPVLGRALSGVGALDSLLAERIREALTRAPIERLETYAGVTEVAGALGHDLDGDGTPEAVAWLRPALRQTPTVLIFRRNAAGEWQRVLEGLAPGRLRAVSGKLTDSHVHGVGVDMVAGDGSRENTQRVLAAGPARGMSLVAYEGFLHADLRQQATFVIDLSAGALPKGTDKTCEKFEFSTPETLVAGLLRGDGTRSYLVALTEEDLTLYRITAIDGDGRLTFETWMRPRPTGAIRLGLDAAGQAVVISAQGQTAIDAP